MWSEGHTWLRKNVVKRWPVRTGLYSWGFPLTHEEDCTILVFVLRRIDSHGAARCWLLVLGWVVRNGRQASCITNSGSVRTIDARSSCMESLSLGVECRSRISWCTFVQLREKRFGAILCVSTCANRSASVPCSTRTISGPS